jgi:hypothetical protein
MMRFAPVSAVHKRSRRGSKGLFSGPFNGKGRANLILAATRN